MELRDYYNVNKEKIGETYTDNIMPTGDKYMLIVACFIQNSEGKYLIQKASKSKGEKWGTISGHPKAGENSIEGLKREIHEEYGIKIASEKYQFIDTFIANNKILDLYYINENVNIADLLLQVEEVVEVKWATNEEIENLIKHDMFEKTHSKLFKSIINLKK